MRQGDVEAFATLMARYLDDVTRFAFYMTHSRDLADDVAQQVFINLWEHRAGLDPARPVKPYLLRSVRNRAFNERKADAVRNRYRNEVYDDLEREGLHSSIPSPEDAIVTAETLRMILRQLPERRRLAIRLRVIDGMSHQEIAEVLQLSPAAARQLISRAMTEIRKVFKKRHILGE